MWGRATGCFRGGIGQGIEGRPPASRSWVGPVYSATLRGDGTVLYHGVRHVSRLGEHRGRVETRQFVWLARFVLDSGYLRLPERYAAPLTDLETVTTSAVVDGKRKTVTDYGQTAPPLVWAVEQLIDKLVADARWEDDTASPRTSPERPHHK